MNDQIARGWLVTDWTCRVMLPALLDLTPAFHVEATLLRNAEGVTHGTASAMLALLQDVTKVVEPVFEEHHNHKTWWTTPTYASLEAAEYVMRECRYHAMMRETDALVGDTRFWNLKQAFNNVAWNAVRIAAHRPALQHTGDTFDREAQRAANEAALEAVRVVCDPLRHTAQALLFH